ncbi:MAG TPA: sigma-70 family RNA polymerase sigma factor [Chitinophagaceae bacterium]|nr:sigma-70 family RNA polymerase sigma factor [Chitinophagaceae bacterium]
MELAQLYVDLKGTLLDYISPKVRNKQDAEDILHNTFIKIAANLSPGNRPGKLRNWIFTVTKNNIIDYYRTKSTTGSLPLNEDLLDQSPVDEYIDVTKGLDCCLMNFVNQLPEEYKEILIDVELKGVKQKDLADKYGLAYSSIRSRVQRGREKLKNILLECCRIEADNRGNILEVESRSGCGPSNRQTCKN